MFRWATENELIGAEIYDALRAVGGLRQGRTEARETEPVQPVDERLVQGTLKHVNRYVGAMIRLQQFTGMRPGEIVNIKKEDFFIEHEDGNEVGTQVFRLSIRY